ncbi:MAG TPA: hypothetical protein VMR39_06865, partial [Sphingobium sp.]|nr:hypothetical protein [Sphingobium sp.]
MILIPGLREACKLQVHVPELAGVIVEPLAVIGAGAHIGAGTRIGPGVIIGPHVQVGRDCTISGGASILVALIGNNV